MRRKDLRQGPFNKYVTVEGDGEGSRHPWQTGGGSGLIRYVIIQKVIAVVILMCIYCQYIDRYLRLIAFKSPRVTTFRFTVLHFLLKSLCNWGFGGGAKLINRYETWHRGGVGRKSCFLALRTYWMVPYWKGLHFTWRLIPRVFCML